MTEYFGNDILSNALAELKQLELFAGTVYQGLAVSMKATVMLDWLARFVDNAETPAQQAPGEKRKVIALQEEWAKQQHANDFPYLHALLCIRLWAILESLVDDLAARILANPDGTCDSDVIAKIRIPLMAITLVSPQDRGELALQELKRLIAAPLKLGAGRFEDVLAPLGLGGPIDDEVRRVILEMSQTRHVLLHRGGIVDAKLIAACPWLNLNPGDQVKIGHDKYVGYLVASHLYWLELGRRCRARGRGSIAPNMADEELDEELIRDGNVILRKIRGKFAGNQH